MANKLYKYKNSHNLKTTADIAEITPIYANVLFPGEEIKELNFKNITRMITPLLPTLDNAKIELYAFGIPERILKTNNKEIEPTYTIEMEENAFKYINQKLIEQNPFINTNSINNEKPEEHNLYKKFGINTNKIKGNRESWIQIEYLLAYWKVYESYFKEKRIEKFNYWTWYNSLTDFGTVTDWSINEGHFSDEQKPNSYDMGTALCLLNKIAKTNTQNDFLKEMTFEKIETQFKDNWNMFKKELSNNYIKNKKITKHINNGTIKDILIEIWNENNKDKTNPTLLGYEEWNQTITQITNQTKSTSQPLGEVGGMSATYNTGTLIKNYKVNEKTYILILAVPTYKMTIANSFDTEEWIYEDITSEYNPNINYTQKPKTNVGYLNEKYDSTKIIGYVPPFNFLREKKDIVAGEIMDNWSNWTYTSKNQYTNFNTNIFKMNKKPFKDTLTSTQQDSFIMEYQFYSEIERTIKPLSLIEEKLIEGK